MHSEIDASFLHALGKEWRQKLQHHLGEMRNAFSVSENPKRLIDQHRRFVDEMLKSCWQACQIDHSISLIAVGGYGRGDLYPYSDIDLLILLPEENSTSLNQQVENIVGLFWDMGLAIGHSVRTLPECLEEASKDITVQTTLIEARYLSGNKPLFNTFVVATFQQLNVREFVQSKLLEQQLRHKRFNDTAYNLEPNIKESPGGLRDLQVVLWLTKCANLGNSWLQLVKSELITVQEAKAIRRHELQLQKLRIRLHLLAKRREDRLLFDFQNELASQFGFVTDKNKRASEKLMAGFYKSAKAVILFNEILLQSIQDTLRTDKPEITSLNHPWFYIKNDLLEIRSVEILQQHPSSLLEIFLLIAKHVTIKGLSTQLLRELMQVKGIVNSRFRDNAEHKRLFIEIMQQPQGVTRALRKMNQYGILGRYIPVFGKIVGQMQHDLFHVYTVDEHILNVLGNLRRFTIAEHKHEFPLCSQLIRQFDKPHLLYIAALFHDIAKGRGGDHSDLGTVDAVHFCSRHGLAKEETELVAWLVKAHLRMSNVAQKSDLSDPENIENFANEVGNEYRLTALYLLTVADIRGTSPAVWNAWKAKLLEHLFVATRRLLQGTVTNKETSIKDRQRRAIERLSGYGIVEKDYLPLWNKLGRAYFVRHDNQEISWHTRLLLTHVETKEIIVRARLSPGGDGIQVLIYLKDRDDIFTHICGFFDRMGYSILEAKVHTTSHGYALDSFLICNENEKNVVYRDLLNYIQVELTQLLLSNKTPITPLKGRVSRQVKHMPIKTTIQITYDVKQQNHKLTITTNDRPGLLSQIAQVFYQLGIELHNAKINTLGNRVEDMFIVSARQGAHLDEGLIAELNQQLSTLLATQAQ